MIPRPQGGGHVTIDLVVSQHYYIGTYLQGLVLAPNFRIEQRSCQEAQQDNKERKAP